MNIQTKGTTVDLSLTSSYDYELPQELIAQNPAEPRDSSRLLVVHRQSATTEDRIFHDITEYLRPGDLLVLNDTRVLPARTFGRKITEKGEGAHVEIFFLRPGKSPDEWTALVRPGRKLHEGTPVALDEKTRIIVGERLSDGLRTIKFAKDADPLALIHKFGNVPLPPYITHSTAAPERYQTVYAKLEKENSAAAPTAGLHFTPELLKKLEDGGVPHTFITLQVGLGTFRPVKCENIAEHVMHREICEVPQAAADAIAETKAHGGRVVSVGTTVVRTLESFAREFGCVQPGMLDTALFINPGYEFRVIDALITNFHLPKSTLLMLVCAFGGYELMMKTYREAVQKRYRFFSFGDAMFID